MAMIVYLRVLNPGLIQQSPFVRDLLLFEVTLITASSSLIRVNQNLGRNWKNCGLNSLIPEKRIQRYQNSKQFFGHFVYDFIWFLTSPYSSKENNVFIIFLVMWCPNCDFGETWQPFYGFAGWSWRKSDLPNCCKNNEKVPPPMKQHECLSLGNYP